MKLALGVYLMVPALASTISTVPLVAWVTAVMTGEPSNESLVTTLRVLAVSSSVVWASSWISATALMVRLMSWVVLLPASSVMVTVKLSVPL